MNQRHIIMTTAMLAFLSNAAFAGLKKNNEGLQFSALDQYGSRMFGSLSATRASDDDISFITITHNGNYYSTIEARDSDGVSRSCATANQKLMDLLRSSGSDSYIHVLFDVDGKCISALIKNSSAYGPKKP